MVAFSHDFRHVPDTFMRRRLEELDEECRNQLTLAERAARECDAVNAAMALRRAEGALDRHLVTMDALAKRMKGGRDTPFIKAHRSRQDLNAYRLTRSYESLAGFADMCQCTSTRPKPGIRYEY